MLRKIRAALAVASPTIVEWAFPTTVRAGVAPGWLVQAP